jgi:hypothetical protein
MVAGFGGCAHRCKPPSDSYMPPPPSTIVVTAGHAERTVQTGRTQRRTTKRVAQGSLSSPLVRVCASTRGRPMRSGMRSQPGSRDARRTPAAWRAGRQGDQRWPALPRVDRDCLDWQTPRRWPSSAAGSNCPASGTTSAPTTTRRYAHSASKRRIDGSTGPPTTTGQSEGRGSESMSPRGRNQAGRITTSRVSSSSSTASSGDPGLGNGSFVAWCSCRSVVIPRADTVAWGAPSQPATQSCAPAPLLAPSVPGCSPPPCSCRVLRLPRARPRDRQAE